ncbi:DNA cytosine methyltransferase [Kitasatospora sp. NPDC001132]
MILELCAGYGGLGLAVEHLTGERVGWVAEIDPHASKILAERFPDAPNLGDITGIDWGELDGQVTVLTAGFPCQGISNAGLRKGLEDERSALWFTVLEAVRRLRPGIVFLENVAAIRRRGLAEVLGGLAEVGYDVRWTSFRASGVGAAHHRDRWFAVAVPTSENPDGQLGRQWGSPASGQAARCSCNLWICGGGGGGQSAGSRTQPHGATLADEVCFLLPYANRQRRLGRSGDESGAEGWPEPSDARHSPAAWWGDYLPAVRRWERIFGRAAPAPTERGPRGGIRLTARFGEWLMGLAAGWVTDVPGLSRGQQLKAIGNGVAPQQAYTAYKHLLTYADDGPAGETDQG